MPIVSYSGGITLVDNEAGVAAAAECLAKETVIGFDTETKPAFKRGQTNNVALLQLSTRSHCFLFRLNRIGLPVEIKNILENNSILKIGVSIHDDFHNLNKLYQLEPRGFVDLQTFVKPYHIADNSLARIYAVLFGMRISKSQRLTNWEAEELTPHQQAYAALDALACVEIYRHLIDFGFDYENSPYYREIEVPNPKPTKEN